jgi:hypothetical protein
MPAAWLQSTINFLAGGQYNASLTPVTSGQVAPVDMDAYGRLRVIPGQPVSGVDYGTLWADGTALVNSLVVKNSVGSLVQVVGFNDSASTLYLHAFNASALPSNGTAPRWSFRIASGTNFALDLTMRPRPFATGIVLAGSSTPATLTVTTTPALWLSAEYV